jgi:hypothetical protein
MAQILLKMKLRTSKERSGQNEMEKFVIALILFFVTLISLGYAFG